MHNGLTISTSWQPIKCLKPSLLCLNLSDTTICQIQLFIKYNIVKL